MTPALLDCTVTWHDGARGDIPGSRSIVPHLDDEHVERLVAAALEQAASPPDESVELGVTFVTTERMLELNVQHRGVQSATDVLSFPIDGLEDLVPPGAARQLGDVVVCPERVQQQVATGDTMVVEGGVDRGIDATIEAALERCIVHGVLHLCGFDHERGPADAKAMFHAEDQALDLVRAGRSGR